MVDRFEQATRDRGMSTLLYEDPDAHDDKDHDLVLALNLKLQTDENYPLPEGFMKIKERRPVYNYDIPEYTKEIAGEPMVMSLMILDELVSELIGIHFIEPTVRYQEKLKVKRIMNKLEKPTPKSTPGALNYMQPKGSFRIPLKLQ